MGLESNGTLEGNSISGPMEGLKSGSNGPRTPIPELLGDPANALTASTVRCQAISDLSSLRSTPVSRRRRDSWSPPNVPIARLLGFSAASVRARETELWFLEWAWDAVLGRFHVDWIRSACFRPVLPERSAFGGEESLWAGNVSCVGWLLDSPTIGKSKFGLRTILKMRLPVAVVLRSHFPNSDHGGIQQDMPAKCYSYVPVPTKYPVQVLHGCARSPLGPTARASKTSYIRRNPCQQKNSRSEPAKLNGGYCQHSV